MGKVYFFTNGENIKIGYTNNTLKNRLKQLNTGSDNQLYALGYITGDKEKEKELHLKFSREKIRNNGEWFYPSSEIIDYINSVNEKENIYIEKDIGTNKLIPLFKISKS